MNSSLKAIVCPIDDRGIRDRLAGTALAAFRAGHGKRQGDELRKLIADMKDEESRLLRERARAPSPRPPKKV